MSEPTKQHWRFELGRFPSECKIFLNDEQWLNVRSLKIEAGYDEGHPTPTVLTFSVYPHEVQVDILPSLQGELDNGLFGERARHDAGEAQSSRGADDAGMAQ
jgi:hypothetical protein